ncbi:hypothetical protein [Allohahella marinimesophila]
MWPAKAGRLQLIPLQVQPDLLPYLLEQRGYLADELTMLPLPLAPQWR